MNNIKHYEAFVNPNDVSGKYEDISNCLLNVSDSGVNIEISEGEEYGEVEIKCIFGGTKYSSNDNFKKMCETMAELDESMDRIKELGYRIYNFSVFNSNDTNDTRWGPGIIGLPNDDLVIISINKN